MTTPKGMLVAAFDSSSIPKDEYDDWYDTEHIPDRQKVPGFLTLERWVSIDHPRHTVATYDLERSDVLTSAPYLAIARQNSTPWTRRITGRCQQILRFEGNQTLPGADIGTAAAGALVLNAMNCPPEAEDEFNAWYDEEHIPQLAAVKGCLNARRFVALASSHKYLALYHIASPEVQAGTAWAKAVETPWTSKMRPHMRDRIRIVCRRYVRGA
jgi:hypothetical protein